MNRQDLIDTIAGRTDASKAATSRFVDAFIDVIQNAVSAGQKVRIAGFGTFEKSTVSPRRARHPRTGEPIMVPAFDRPKFTPGEAFKNCTKQKPEDL